MSDYVDQLFHYLPSEQIQTLSCGHVIPPSNLVAMPIARGPGGIEFDFTFEKRNLDSMASLPSSYSHKCRPADAL